MPRMSEVSESLIGKVCSCSLGRVGVVVRLEDITFQNGDVAKCWTGMGLDGRGLWATGANAQVVVLADHLTEYMDRIKARPNNVLYATPSVPAPKN
jgi:hypothetical protein